MLSESDWRYWIDRARGRAPRPAKATTILERKESKNRPLVVRCDDRRTYYVKGRQCGRCIFTDYVVGRLGRAMGAPVAQVRTVDVPEELIVSNLELLDVANFQSGTSFGSVEIPDCRDSYDYEKLNEPENMARFAFLAALFGCVVADDRHYLYRIAKPYLVYSADHCEFLPGGPAWKSQTLMSAPMPALDIEVALGADLSIAALRAGQESLARLSDVTIAACIGTAPSDWDVDASAETKLAEFLSQRRDQLLSLGIS